jgi:serine/threonine-protein kinase RsbW
MSAAANIEPLPRTPATGSPGAHAAPPAEFDRFMPSDSQLIAGVRAEFRTWLTSCGIGADDLDALVLACSEAIANSIEHAYRGDGSGIVRITGHCDGRHVDVFVHDDGPWIPPRHRNPDESGLLRGRGLPLIGQLMDATELDTRDGTTITMRRRLRYPRQR